MSKNILKVYQRVFRSATYDCCQASLLGENSVAGHTNGRFKSDLTAHCPSRNKTFAQKVKAGIYDEYIGQYRFELRPELVIAIMRDGGRL